ncbi:MAG: non-lysosomal glucosylceramidase [Fibromonadales bacterium]|nr:non-lysosomal glucosylceramidase [Fibromonadales bacterium]
MFTQYLSQSALKGTVKDLITSGLAAEFKQPWYTPLTTTPSTTGIAVGGIGSAFTVTPAGTTPVMHFLPGIQVRGEKDGDLKLNDFYYKESVQGSPLIVENATQVYELLSYFPLADIKGNAIVPQGLTEEEIAKLLENATKKGDLYGANEESLNRWRIEWSRRTEAMLANNNRSPRFQKLWLIDFFDGLVGEVSERQGSLTAAWGKEQEISGQPGYDPELMEYTALYPVSATKYVSKKTVNIRKIQISPVLPGNERLSSLPVNATIFELENPTSKTREITIVQMQDNMCGYNALKDRHGVQDASFVLQPNAKFPQAAAYGQVQSDGRHTIGIEFFTKKFLAESDCAGRIAIAASWNTGTIVQASTKPMFYKQNEESVLKGALLSGRVSKNWSKGVYSGKEIMAGALCVTIELPPNTSAKVQFSMALDFPLIRMNGLTSVKKYTEFYPDPDRRIKPMLSEFIEAVPRFESAVPSNYNRLVPEHASKNFKTLAINTLSFLAEATVWDKEDRFLVRECADYPFFNSLDVYFYGSFSLLALLPRLDGCVMRNFADAVLAVNPQIRRHHKYVNLPYADLPEPKLEGPRGVRGAVIHDLGSPFDAAPDAYDWHNVKEWKDLAPKFVLMVIRHYQLTGDISVLKYCKEAIYAAMEYLEKLVEPGQVFPLTHGTDDTFDNLASHGISVYCGSFWIAGLRAAAKIAETLGEHDRAAHWNGWANDAQRIFHEVLWNEKEGYFLFYVCKNKGINDDVFADALLADTYLRLLNLEPIVDSKKAKKALTKIYNTNYKKNSPLIGAANLVHKDGSPLDEFNFQAHDVWTGVQYSIATAMYMHGMKKEAEDLTETTFRNLYKESKIPFAAPEGFNGSCRLHACGIVSKTLLSDLKKSGALLSDCRISPDLPRDLNKFEKEFKTLCAKHKIKASELFILLHSTALKYTAGKYFRPGMVFAIAKVM